MKTLFLIINQWISLTHIISLHNLGKKILYIHWFLIYKCCDNTKPSNFSKCIWSRRMVPTTKWISLWLWADESLQRLGMKGFKGARGRNTQDKHGIIMHPYSTALLISWLYTESTVALHTSVARCIRLDIPLMPLWQMHVSHTITLPTEYRLWSLWSNPAEE